mmetsp:Transcript_49304/g.56795  ORF Transcript_49304/g.56795 Transcript_49304/m.56795 type:complete len:427 (-) Transcript_49304:177-1457(-)
MGETTTQKFREYDKFAVLYFYLQGIGSLLGWNAVLTAYDFFAVQYPDYNVYKLFSIPKFSANLVVCPLMLFISSKFSLNQRISGGLYLIGVALLVLPAVAEIMTNTVGFAIVMILLFILGGLNGISCSSVVGFTANFPHFYMAKVMAGSGIAGLILNATRAICLGIFGSSEGLLESTIVYFVLSSLMSVACGLVHMKFVTTEFSQYYASKGDLNAIADDEADGVTSNEEQTLSAQLIIPKVAANGLNNPDSNSLLGTEVRTPPTFFGVMKEIPLYAGLLTLLYVQTFMLFPGVSLARIIGNLDGAWNTVVVITTFNLFDTIGKTIAEKRSLYNKYTVIGVIVFRFIFFVTFLHLKASKNTGFFDSDAFAIINMSLFATFNGYCTSALFTMGPEAVKPYKRETAGFIMQLALYTGIISGSYLSLVLP